MLYKYTNITLTPVSVLPVLPDGLSYLSDMLSYLPVLPDGLSYLQL